MTLLVVADAHLFKYRDGSIWTPAIYKYDFWTRYMEVFEKVRVACRTKNVDFIDSKWLRVDGPKLEFVELPFFQTKKELFEQGFELLRSFRNIYDGCDAAIFRMPCPLGTMLYSISKPKIPLAVEVVYNPVANFSLKNGFFNNAEQRLTRHVLKEICKRANGVSYVTKKTIQKNYPSQACLKGETEAYFTAYYSTITLKDNAFSGPRKKSNTTRFVAVHSNVSMNNTDRKGEIVLLKAIAYARKKGAPICGVFMGDGPSRTHFEQVADELGIREFVNFTGLLPADDVYKVLREGDVYVLPSKGEGLPRGVIEAMAAGMPCISSPVGGIPEILDNYFIIDPSNYEMYGERLYELWKSEKLYIDTSTRNYNKALEFKNDLLQQRRNEFYTKLKKLAVKKRG